VKQGDKAEMIKKLYFASFMMILGITMAISIVMIGIYTLLSPSFSYWPKYFRTIFAMMMIAYGLYRSVKIFRIYKNKEDKQ
jgi:cytochrome c biogenesis protein CcdA